MDLIGLIIARSPAWVQRTSAGDDEPAIPVVTDRRWVSTTMIGAHYVERRIASLGLVGEAILPVVVGDPLLHLLRDRGGDALQLLLGERSCAPSFVVASDCSTTMLAMIRSKDAWTSSTSAATRRSIPAIESRAWPRSAHRDSR